MSASIAPTIGAPYARILAVGGYRPERVVTNAEICERIDSSDEWIRERSGIIERRWAAADETVVDETHHTDEFAPTETPDVGDRHDREDPQHHLQRNQRKKLQSLII